MPILYLRHIMSTADPRELPDVHYTQWSQNRSASHCSESLSSPNKYPKPEAETLLYQKRDRQQRYESRNSSFVQSAGACVLLLLLLLDVLLRR